MENPITQGLNDARKYLCDDGFEKASTDLVAAAAGLFALSKSNEKCLFHTKKYMLEALMEVGERFESPFDISDFIENFGE